MPIRRFPLPPLSRPKLAAIARLAERLRATLPAELAAAADRAESLARELDAEGLYPEDWLVWRLTGVMARVPEPRQLVGSALLADLSSLVEHLTDADPVPPEALGPGALDIPALCARWGVSRTTLDRYRRMGLIARRVDLGEGHRSLMFTAGTVAAFEAAHAERLRRARGFARSDARTQRSITRRARRYAALGFSLNRAAARIAPRFGLSHEGARQALGRATHDDGSPVFAARGPAGAREHAVFWRAGRRGLEPGEIAKRCGLGKPAIVRGALQHRTRVLLELERAGAFDRPVLPTFSRPDAAEVLLAPAVVRTDLAGALPGSIGALVEIARTARAVPAADESALAAAMHYLVARARGVIAPLRVAAPDAAAIDIAETDLRWATMLKARLVRGALATSLAAAESRLGTPIDRLPEALAVRTVRAMLAASSQAAAAFDPTHGGRLAGRVSIAVDRVAARIEGSVPDGRGVGPGRAARVLRTDLTLGDVESALDPWGRWQVIDPRVRAAATVSALAGGVKPRVDQGRQVTIARHGLDGRPPRTLDAAAREVGVPVMQAARAERAFVRAARSASRGEGDAGTTGA